MNTYTFIITSFIIILIPGTGVLYTISTGITKGKKASVIAALGCTIGIIPHLIISIELSSLLLKMTDQLFLVLKLVGALYLIYLGVGMFRSKVKTNFSDSMKEFKTTTMIRTGVLINLLNPKLSLFFFSFLPQYVSCNKQEYTKEVFLLGIAFMILTFIVFILYGIMAGSMKRLVTKSPKRILCMQQILGVIFIAFAVNLIVGYL